MNATSYQIHESVDVANNWLNKFESTLAARDRNRLADLFQEDSHWRDMLAFTWEISPYERCAEITKGLVAHQSNVNARNFRIDRSRTPPRIVRRLGEEIIEVLFEFETDTSYCNGVLRLQTRDPSRAWVFATALREIKGHPEPIGKNRPTVSAQSRNFSGENWEQLRKIEQEFQDHDPTVLIIGGSQFGITLAARLKLQNVDALVCEKTERIGDAWRHRYHSLELHNQVGKNHFPYIPFPPNWPKYLPKDMLANFIEFYAWAMECNVWTSTEFVNAFYDEDDLCWTARVRKPNGKERTLRPRHLVFANGVLGDKKIPNMPGFEEFAGEVIHAEDYYSGERYRGKNVLVIGTGVSGHDCAQDLHGHGASVKIVQRGSTTVTSIEAAAFSDSLYLDEGLPLDDADLLGVTPTPGLLEKSYQSITAKAVEHDEKLLAGLEAKGFKLDYGPNGAGFQMKLRVRHGGYYLNCGCSDLIVNGDVGLLRWDDAQQFVKDGLLMKDGRVEEADLVVTATGYSSQEEVIERVLGKEIAGKVGQIWGLDERGELANMFVPTKQKGLWFMGGGLSQSRVYSKYLALRIKAEELGLVGNQNRKVSNIKGGL